MIRPGSIRRLPLLCIPHPLEQQQVRISKKFSTSSTTTALRIPICWQHHHSSTYATTASASATLSVNRFRRRNFASSSPLPQYEEEPVEVQVTAVTQTPRPRLQELRARLSTEFRSGDVTKLSAPPRKGNEINIVEHQEDLLRSQLAALPDPPLAGSLVLTDKHQRQHTYLRLSVTERCNLRCTYCMPEQGVPLQKNSQLLTTPELLLLARHFRGLGVTKFRLTGGEPTLRSDLVNIVDGLAQLDPVSIGVTTNGIALGGSSNKLQALHEAGLTGVNLSLDTLDPAEFAALTRRPETYLQRVLHCLDQAVNISAGDPSFIVKLNCVVIRGTNDHCVADFVRLADQYPGLQIRFIEYMPFSDNGWNWDKCVPYRELLQNLSELHGIELIPLPADDPHDTTKWFSTQKQDGGSKIGFITSMSQHFCASCNRLRLTADGQIKVCLFDGGSSHSGVVSLRDALRSGFTANELNKLIYAAVQSKHASLGGHTDPTDILRDADNNRPMTLIGG